LCENFIFKTPNGRAQIPTVRIPRLQLGPQEFLLSTRRGKQFNSMVQRERDPLNAARREDVLINEMDARQYGLQNDDWVVLRSSVGQMRCRVLVSQIRPGNLQVHWPEGNVLVRRGRIDPACGIPDYNAVVRMEKAPDEPIPAAVVR
jgi:anaerobic selenocysteine-containing dehydrogenase